MMLLNSAALFAAAALVVPIFVHLRKRRKSRVVDWPAMQFLTRTVAARRRGLLLEHLALLFLRCSIVLLFVLAMARPAIESHQRLSMFFVFFLAASGLLLLTWAFVSQSRLRGRLAAAAIAGLLFVCCGALFSVRPESVADSQVDRDVAIVVDASLTMTFGEQNYTHFERAISQAESLVSKLSGRSTASIIVAGPVAETASGSPFRNLSEAEKRLESLSPIAGGTDLASAVKQATSLLKRAPNRHKQLLILTDDQLRNWESLEATPFAAAAGMSVVQRDSHQQRDAAKTVESEIANEKDVQTVSEIACAALVARLPETIDNISVDRVRVDSSLITADRLVPVDIEICNGGSTIVRDLVVKLLIDGRLVASDSIDQIEPGVRSTVRLLHAFPETGQRTVSGVVEVADRFEADNRRDVIVDVRPHVAILIVDGSGETDLAQRSATFARLALDPVSLREPLGGDARDDVSDATTQRAIVATTVEAARLDDIESLEPFQLLMLCGVPRLPTRVANRVASYVESGGGLWVIPNEHADISFYNSWNSSQPHVPVLPTRFLSWSRWDDESTSGGQVSRLGIALDVTGRPFVSDLFEHARQDLADISVRNFWQVTPHTSAIVGMRLSNDEPLFVDHAVGRGHVLTQAVSLAREDSSFPANLGFPILMHLWMNHLAGAQRVDFNFEATSEFVTDVSARTDSLRTLRLVEPDATERTVPVSFFENSSFARVGRIVVPGVYKLQDEAGSEVSRFAIQRDPHESDLAVASPSRCEEIARELGIEVIDDVDQLTLSALTELSETEIWDTLLFTVLWLLAAECVVTTWIRARRGLAPASETTTSDTTPGRLITRPLPVSASERPDSQTVATSSDLMSVAGSA